MQASKNPVRDQFLELRDFLNSRVIGQQHLISRMLVGLLADGHILVEGPPGLAKTRAVKTLANGVEGNYQRIQFTPDLLPADLTGTEVYRPQEGSFEFQQGPLFNQVIVADEVNRAPAKVQSALLEAMEERQITVARDTHPLPDLFFVMATQNPIEQEGTYQLPESQLDRFLLKICIGYPAVTAEVDIMRQVRSEAQQSLQQPDLPDALPLAQQSIFDARQEILSLHMAESVEQYIAQLVNASRNPAAYSEDLEQWIQYGASPRASLAFDRCARALAWLEGDDYVSPEIVQALALEILGHRVLLTYRAEADGVTMEEVINKLLVSVPVA